MANEIEEISESTENTVIFQIDNLSPNLSRSSSISQSV